jgi:putative transposase
LSLRIVEEMLAARGNDVGHESVRHWADAWGQYSDRIRGRAPARGDRCGSDEVVITICGRKQWLRLRSRCSRPKQTRSSRRTAAHEEAFQEVAKARRVVITAELKSYGATRKDVGLGIEHP